MSADAAAAVCADPGAHAGGGGEAIARRAVAVHETHISWVFVAGDRAFRLKKPVVLDFLDYGTPARRRAMCHEEVRLERPPGPRSVRGREVRRGPR